MADPLTIALVGREDDATIQFDYTQVLKVMVVCNYPCSPAPQRPTDAHIDISLVAISQQKSKGEGPVKKRHLDPPGSGDLRSVAMADKSESLGDCTSSFI